MADAFAVPLVMNEEIAETIRGFAKVRGMSDTVLAASLRMARVPEGHGFCPRTWAPRALPSTTFMSWRASQR